MHKIYAKTDTHDRMNLLDSFEEFCNRRGNNRTKTDQIPNVPARKSIRHRSPTNTAPPSAKSWGVPIVSRQPIIHR